MMWQEVIVGVLVAGAALYLVRRVRVRRRRGTCCGEKVCPATRQILERMKGAAPVPPGTLQPHTEQAR